MTYTFATMEVPGFVHALVRQLLLDVNYNHAIDDEAGTLDMHGIALVPGDGPDPLEDMRAAKDGAYLERNRVVAALACCFPAGVGRTAIEGWDPEWHNVVYIDLPTGQVSWHFHDDHEHLFAGLPRYQGIWDGHDTPEKYRRVGALLEHRAAPPSLLHWQSPATAPAVDARSYDSFIVAVRRAHSGQVYTFPAQYLNGYPLLCGNQDPTAASGNGWSQVVADENEESGDVLVTGWYHEHSTPDGEYDYHFEQLLNAIGDELVAWAAIPAYEAAALTRVDAGGCAPPIGVGDFGIEIGATQHGSEQGA